MGAGSAGWCPTGRCPASSQKNRGWDKAGQPGSKRVKQDSLSRVKRALTRLRLATRGIALQPIRKIGAIRVKTSFRPFPDQKSEINPDTHIGVKNQKCFHLCCALSSSARLGVCAPRQPLSGLFPSTNPDDLPSGQLPAFRLRNAHRANKVSHACRLSNCGCRPDVTPTSHL
jgi:hypothetical protein